MLSVLVIVLVLFCGYGAYRAIRGGFERPQSEKLNGYGIIGGIVLVLLAVELASKLFSP